MDGPLGLWLRREGNAEAYYDKMSLEDSWEDEVVGPEVKAH